MAVITPNKPACGEFVELVQKFPLKPIRTPRQLAAAHRIIDELVRIPAGRLTSDQSDYLEVLGDLTLAYQQKQVSEEIEEVTGRKLLLHLMEEHGLNASALGTLLGHRELGSKILRGEREISKSHARILSQYFGLPAETFLR